MCITGRSACSDGGLVTSGTSGYTLVVTGTGDTVRAARDAANALADKVVVANARYRRDIGDKLIAGELAQDRSLGLARRLACCR